MLFRTWCQTVDRQGSRLFQCGVLDHQILNLWNFRAQVLKHYFGQRPNSVPGGIKLPECTFYSRWVGGVCSGLSPKTFRLEEQLFWSASLTVQSTKFPEQTFCTSQHCWYDPSKDSHVSFNQIHRKGMFCVSNAEKSNEYGLLCFNAIQGQQQYKLNCYLSFREHAIKYRQQTTSTFFVKIDIFLLSNNAHEYHLY